MGGCKLGRAHFVIFSTLASCFNTEPALPIILLPTLAPWQMLANLGAFNLYCTLLHLPLSSMACSAWISGRDGLVLLLTSQPALLQAAPQYVFEKLAMLTLGYIFFTTV